MAPWEGERKDSWASNPNIAVYIFAVLFAVWIGFQVWARLPNGPSPPTELGPMVMAALGVAITVREQSRRNDKADERKAEIERESEGESG